MARRKFIHEHFDTINELLSTLDGRTNNSAMSGNNSSRNGGQDFTGTRNYEEAAALIREGYTEILPQIKQDLRTNAKVYAKYLEFPAKIPKNAIVGYIPNVPNALQNLPNSMITTDLVSQKRKTIDIYYSNCGNCGESTDFFIKAGVALLTAINIIEAKGIRVRLNLLFMTASTDRECCCPSLLLKSYGQKFDIQKLCFPIAHPSMFRRIGFKFLETSPGVTDSNFSGGYGRPNQNLDELATGLELDETQFVIDSNWIRSNNYSVESILNRFKIDKG